jgi:GT2 family glycosyltransferase
VVVAGMHRSGTSYVASWLAAAGIDMGERLLPADAANRRGYFEDVGFLSLQRRMLAAAVPADEAGHPDWGWTESERLDESRFADFEAEARALAARRGAASGGRPWGWKDPRSSLALDFWQRVLAGAGLSPCWVLLYRFPWEVADSMQRLGAEAFLRHPEYGLRIWAFYNRRLLDFRRRAAGRTLLLSVNALAADPARFGALLRERLGVSVADEPPAGLFEPELFAGRERDDPLPGLVGMVSPTVTALLAELDQAADLPAAGLWAAAPPARRRRAAASGPASGIGISPASVGVAAAASGAWVPPASGAGAPAASGSGVPPVPVLSVVTPCLDHGELLVDAVASFERSAPPGSELIIVDDGSTQPRTREVLAALRAAGYTVIDQPHGGLAAARNRAVAAARAPYILPLDSDNRLRPGFPAAAIAVLDADPAVGVVYGDRWELGQRSGRVRVPELDLDRLLTGNYIDACAVFRRSIWEACGGYDPLAPGWEDWELWISAAARGWRFHRLDEITFDYRVRPDSLVATCRSAEVGERLQRHIVTKHRELYLDRLPALLTVVQHGRPGAAGGLVVGAEEGGRERAWEQDEPEGREDLARLREELRREREAMRQAHQALAAEVAGLRARHGAMAAEGEALRARVAELAGAVESWQSAAAELVAERDRLDAEVAAWRRRVGFMEGTRAWRLRESLLRLRKQNPR